VEPNRNMIDTYGMSREEIADHREELQRQVDVIDANIEMHLAKGEGVAADPIWVANARMARKMKVRAITKLGEELAAMRRKEERDRQKSLESCFMVVVRGRVPQDEFYSMLREAQASAEHNPWEAVNG